MTLEDGQIEHFKVTQGHLWIVLVAEQFLYANMGFYDLAFDQVTRLKWIPCLTSGTGSEVFESNDTIGQNDGPQMC